MRLATYMHQGTEKWGFVLSGPNGDYLCCPQDVEDHIDQIRKPGSNFHLEQTAFLTEKRWPADLVSFLRTEDRGMTALRNLHAFMQRYAWSQDIWMCSQFLIPLDQVILKAPIPRPRIYWGLVSNCPSFCRLNENRKQFNLVPQGHNRPQSACCGAGETLILDESNFNLGFNVELGVIIGKQGRNIRPEEAMNYVAGYTNVMDISTADFFTDYDPAGTPNQARRVGKDFFIDATASWGGKKMDCMAPMGPYLVTRDEVLNPYDLLCYTRQNGLQRDRCWSGALMVGIERTIAYYSSFATLFPGDVLHMATMGIDGLTIPDTLIPTPEDILEAEIEHLGCLKIHICRPEKNDWRTSDDPTRSGVRAPAVRDLIERGTDSCDHFDLNETRSFWICHGNYRTCQEEEGLIPLMDIPRFLNNPVSALSVAHEVTVSPRMTDADLTMELALVLKQVTSRVPEKDAANYILGYTPMVAIRDHSLYDELPKPATGQEAGLTRDVYCRWGDGYNLLSPDPVFADSHLIRSCRMTLEVDGIGSLTANTADYLVPPDKVISAISSHITLTPNDVISLGRIGATLPISAEQLKQGIHGRVTIEHIGSFPFYWHK